MGLSTYAVMATERPHRSSLVCLFWAEQCRKVLHDGETVVITSRKSAGRFLQLVITERNGVGRLTPLQNHIARINVRCYFSGESWIHLLAKPLSVADKLEHLSVSGEYFRDNFTRELLQSPHCGIPPSLPMTPSYFKSLENLWLPRIEWDVDDVVHVRATGCISTRVHRQRTGMCSNG